MDKDKLPKALTDSDDFRSLSDREMYNFCSRINYISKIAAEIEESLGKVKSTQDLKLFLDDLELDVSVNQNVSSCGENITAWVIHHSWTFDLKGSFLKNQLSADLVPFLDGQVVNLKCTTEQYTDWLLKQAQAIKITLNYLFSSNSFQQAVAYIIAIDILLASTLAGLYKARLKDFEADL